MIPFRDDHIDIGGCMGLLQIVAQNIFAQNIQETKALAQVSCCILNTLSIKKFILFSTKL